MHDTIECEYENMNDESRWLVPREEERLFRSGDASPLEVQGASMDRFELHQRSRCYQVLDTLDLGI